MSGEYLHGYISPGGPFCVTPSLPSVVASNEKMIEPDAWSFRLYPNPTTSNFTLELSYEPNGSPVEIHIYNMMGKMIFQRMIYEGKYHEFSMETQAPGIYLVKVGRKGISETLKIIKQ